MSGELLQEVTSLTGVSQNRLGNDIGMKGSVDERRRFFL